MLEKSLGKDFKIVLYTGTLSTNYEASGILDHFLFRVQGCDANIILELVFSIIILLQKHILHISHYKNELMVPPK